jgi:hypothetical protein
MDSVQDDFKNLYNQGYSRNKVFDSKTALKNAQQILKKFSPVNSSLNNNAINSDVDKAIDQVSARIYHFDKEIQYQLSKLYNKDIRSNEQSILISHKSITPTPDSGVESKNKLKIKNSMKLPIKKQSKAFIDNLLKSKSIRLDAKIALRKTRRTEIAEKNLEKLDKIISDCESSLESSLYSNSIENKYDYTKAFGPNKALRSFDDTYKYKSLQGKKENVNFIDIGRVSLSTKKKRKSWKPNHQTFITNVDKVLYSVRKYL